MQALAKSKDQAEVNLKATREEMGRTRTVEGASAELKEVLHDITSMQQRKLALEQEILVCLALLDMPSSIGELVR